MDSEMCNCKTVYHALDANHEKCILELADKKTEEKETDVICSGGYLTIFGYAAIELGNRELVMFLLKNFKEKLCDYNHLGMDCLHECVLYNNREYYDFFIDSGATPISEEVIDGLAKYHNLYRFKKEEDDTLPLPTISRMTEGEIEDWNW